MSLFSGTIRGRLVAALAAAVAAGLGAAVKVLAADARAAAKVSPDGAVAERVGVASAFAVDGGHVHLERGDVQHLIDHLPEDDGAPA